MSLFKNISSDAEFAGKNNLAATTAPTATDDSAAGYEVGSVWIDTTNDKAYTCVDATTAAAVWIETTGAGGGGATELNNLTDVTTGLPGVPTNADYGRLLYYDNALGDFVTDDIANISNVVKEVKTSVGTGTIAKGTPVYLDGYDSDLLVVEPADAASAATMACIGIAAETINSTGPNKVVSFGKIQGVDTSLWAGGTVLWVASGGGLTTTRPTGTALVQQVAVILKGNDATGGSIKVFNTSRAASLPNLSNGKIWQGDASGYPVEVDPATAGASWNPPKSSLEDWSRTTGLPAGYDPAALTTAGTSEDTYFYFGKATGGPTGVTSPTISAKFHLGQNNGLDYDGSNLALRITHQLFSTNANAADNVRWEIRYTFFGDGDNGVNKTPTVLTTDIDYTGRTVANGLYTDTLGTITGQVGAKALRISLSRKNADVADTYGNDVDFFNIDIIKV